MICDPNFDHAEYTVTNGKRLKLLLSPTVIVFSVIALVSIVFMLLTVIGIGVII